MILPYWWWGPIPPFGGVGVQPMLSDDCPTVEQQIMLLAYKVKKLEEDGGGGSELDEIKAELLSLQNSLTTLNGELDSVSTTASSNTTAIQDLDNRITTLSTRMTALETYKAVVADYVYEFTFTQVGSITLQSAVSKQIRNLAPGKRYIIIPTIYPTTIQNGDTFSYCWVPISLASYTASSEGVITWTGAIAGYTTASASFTKEYNIRLIAIPSN